MTTLFQDMVAEYNVIRCEFFPVPPGAGNVSKICMLITKHPVYGEQCWLGYDSSTHYGVDVPSTENAFNDALKKVHDHIATCMNQPT